MVDIDPKHDVYHDVCQFEIVGEKAKTLVITVWNDEIRPNMSSSYVSLPRFPPLLHPPT